MNRATVWGVLMAGVVVLSGCQGRTSLFPNPDQRLQKTPAQFSADAAKRHPYKTEAPRGGTIAVRAQVGYTFSEIEIANLTDEELKDVELWINQKYVVFLPSMEPHTLKKVPFLMLYDEAGNSFPQQVQELKERITKVELYKEEKMFDLAYQLAD